MRDWVFGLAFIVLQHCPRFTVMPYAGSNFPADSLIEDIPANATGSFVFPQLSAFIL